MRLLFVTLLFSLNYVSYGQSTNIFTLSQIRRLDSIATQDVPKEAPGIATAIIQDGKVVYEKYAGYADLADSTVIKNSTRFNIASNGKQFTAVAILTLIEEKKLKLSDDIRNWFPNLYPKIKEEITVQSLLNHTSGIRDCYDLWSLQGYTWWKKTFNNNDVLTLVAKQSDLNFQPNTKFLYSNTNYILLALIVEKVSKKSFVEYTNEMFKQLNMPNTSFENDFTKIRGQIARAYFNFDTWTTYQWLWNVCGDGNIFTSLEDQIQWEKLIQGKGTSNFSREVIVKSQQTIKDSKFENYGFGLEFGKYKDLPYRFHEGATGAWKATVIRFPKNNISIVTLTNTGKSTPDTQTRQMADVVFGLRDNTSYLVTKPDIVGSFVSEEEMIGVYQTDNNFTFQFEKVDSILYLKRIGRNDVKLEREADNILHQTYDPDFKQEFKRNEKGEMTVTAYYTSHSPYTLTKSSNDWTGYNYPALNGNFINSETNVSIKIKFAGNKSYDIKRGGKDRTKGILISPTTLLVDNYVFNIDNVASPQVLLLSTDRSEKIKFLRQE